MLHEISKKHTHRITVELTVEVDAERLADTEQRFVTQLQRLDRTALLRVLDSECISTALDDLRTEWNTACLT